MGFFDEIGDKLNNVADKATEKVNSMNETNRLRGELLAEEQKLEQLYAGLGRRIYDIAKGDPTSILSEECKAVTESEARAAFLREQLEPKPVVQPEPEPVVQPEPQPVIPPEPQPVVQPAPQPVIPPKPQPAVQPEPRPASLTHNPYAAPAQDSADTAPKYKKFCPQCGSPNVNNAKFCPTCGTPLSF